MNGPGRRVLGVALAASLLVGACGSTTPSAAPPPGSPGPSPTAAAPSLGPSPVAGAGEDAEFSISVSVPAAQVPATTALLPVAQYRYKGPSDSVKVFHGAPLLQWRIQEIGGMRRMETVVDTICQESTLTKGAQVSQDFSKSGEVSDDPTVGFDRSWYQEPQLMLPAGRWAISATLDLYLGGCGLEHHVVEATIEVAVLG